jgi:hypothetical protein
VRCFSYGHAANPSGSGAVSSSKHAEEEQETVFTVAAKRQKLAKDVKPAPAPIVPGVPFVLKTRQPWATKEVAVPELTEEQEAYIAQVLSSMVLDTHLCGSRNQNEGSVCMCS